MKIAIIGAGISGLSAAYLMHPHHQITVYEQEKHIGGHSRTLDFSLNGRDIAVDTGFIVYNRRNYPHLSALFDTLKVPVAPSSMSFGVSIEHGWLEYGTEHGWSLFAQPRNLLRTEYWHMLWQITKFNRQAKAFVASQPEATIQELITALELSEWFCRYYLLAMAGSIWSVSRTQILDFPAQTLINFFDNHGLLTVNNQPQWYTVVGGSKEYVKLLIASFQAHIHAGCGATSIRREGAQVAVCDTHGQTQYYDQVIMACHSDQALALLTTPSVLEQEILGSITYQENTVVLHTDTRLMPRRRAAWSSWVYLSSARDEAEQRASLSYWMNNLQPLDTPEPIIVTLNPHQEIDTQQVINQHVFAHPVFTQQALEAQNKIEKIQGVDKIWYVGAWQRYGFHEDGIMSAVNIAKKFGVTIPWLQQ